MWIMVITTGFTFITWCILYHFILTLLPCSYYFYVSNNNALCVTPLLPPFCIILDSFVKCLLYSTFTWVFCFHTRKAMLKYYCCHLLNQFIYKKTKCNSLCYFMQQRRSRDNMWNCWQVKGEQNKFKTRCWRVNCNNNTISAPPT